MATLKKENVFKEVKNALVDLFEIEAEEIELSTNLYKDLDLDSLDAVDLVVHLQKLTGKKIKPEEFKQVRTVEDIVVSVEKLLNNEE
jgi:acyl carrier protein